MNTDKPGISSDARIEELEARLAQQDHSILELSEEVYQQQRQIAELELKVRHLSNRLREIALPQSATDPADEVPPHY